MANSSQTLPLITEELTATHTKAHATATDQQSAPSPSTTPHVTTPVMPPNPIHRDTAPESDTQSQATAIHGLPTEVADAVGDRDEFGDRDGTTDKAEKKAKSEGRVSATQLVAGAAAAATSSVIGGQLGVAGTVVGAGVASIITGLAVTLYTSSLDKGKEKIKEVGTKLAPAVKAKAVGAKTQRFSAAARQDAGTFGNTSAKTAKLPSSTSSTSTSQDPSEAADGASAGGREPKSWWRKLRRKRVLYPVTIGVATFGIGLGAVVMAESFTDAEISPGTSEISRSVAGNSGTSDESGTSQDGGGNSDSGSSGADSQPGQNPNQGSGNENSTTNEGQSTSASEGSPEGSSTIDETGTDQGTETGSSATSGDDTAGAGSDSGGSSNTGADTSGGGPGSAEGSSGSGSQGGAGGSSSSDGSGAGSGGGSGDGAGSGSGAGSAGGGSAATAQG